MFVRRLFYVLTIIINILIVCIDLLCVNSKELSQTTIDGTHETIIPSRNELANEYFEHGQYLHLMNNNYLDSLPFYRAATRLNPMEIRYWMQLGYAESQEKLYEKARKRYCRALMLDDNCEICRVQLNLISSFLKNDAKPSAKTLFSISELLSYPIESISNFKGDYPIIIRNVADMLQLNLSAYSPSSLLASYPLELTESYPQNMRSKPSRFYTMTLTETLKFMTYPELAFASVDASESGMYVQWNMNVTKFQSILNSGNTKGTNDVNIESLFQFPSYGDVISNECMISDELSNQFTTKMHWAMILLAESNAGMFFHVDDLPLSSWQFQASGHKAWRLCPSIDLLPDDRMISTLLRSELKFKTRDDFDQDNDFTTEKQKKSLVFEEVDRETLQDWMVELYRSIDFFDEDESWGRRELEDGVSESSQAESIEKIECYEGIAGPGDALYYPRGWWHQTLNLDPVNVALSRSVVSSYNAAKFADAMEQECKHVIVDESVASIDNRYLLTSEKYKFDSALCTAILKNCLIHWQALSQE